MSFLPTSPHKMLVPNAQTIQQFDQEEANEIITIQSTKIVRLQERQKLLEAQNQRFNEMIEYKNHELNHWQDRYQNIQNNLDLPYTKFSKLNQEKQDLANDLARMKDVVESGEEEINQLRELLEGKKEYINLWKNKAFQAENAQNMINSLENRMKMLQLENQRLNSLISKTQNRQSALFLPQQQQIKVQEQRQQPSYMSQQFQ